MEIKYLEKIAGFLNKLSERQRLTYSFTQDTDDTCKVSLKLLDREYEHIFRLSSDGSIYFYGSDGNTNDITEPTAQTQFVIDLLNQEIERRGQVEN